MFSCYIAEDYFISKAIVNRLVIVLIVMLGLQLLNG